MLSLSLAWNITNFGIYYPAVAELPADVTFGYQIGTASKKKFLMLLCLPVKSNESLHNVYAVVAGAVIYRPRRISAIVPCTYRPLHFYTGISSLCRKPSDRASPKQLFSPGQQ